MHYQSDTNIKKSDFAKREEQILAFWREKNIFNKTLEKDAPQGSFTFYEGPPTSNGRPGIHHVESRSFKDALPRYKTMQGFHVRRKAGWDTHGLPVELEVEKQLGLKSKKEIEAYGIAEFNAKCRESVWKYVDEWRDFTERIGYWVDLENPYVTYHTDYIESLWWVMKQIADKDLFYKDYKVVPWCPRCGTGLSSHELAQGYADVKDISVTAKFQILDGNQEFVPSEVEGKKSPFAKATEGQAKTYVLAWTTTPWTLPGNVGLAVGEDIEYGVYEVVSESPDSPVKVGEKVIVAKNIAYQALFNKTGQSDEDYSHMVGPMGGLETTNTEVVLTKTLKGSDLVGLEYKPLFPYLKEIAEKQNIENLENAYKVYSADFVTTEDGTGIVHTAVMYGQEDFDLGQKVGLPKVHTVTPEGTFVEGMGEFSGRSVKEHTDGKPTMDVDIIKYLQEHNTFFAKEKYEHSYPHCWRCKTPLIYYARDSWYINMQTTKAKLIAENQSINWEPAHIRDGRFGGWLSELKDWSISRERFWGTPLPIWQNDDGDRIFIGGFDDLKKYTKKSGNKYTVMRHGQAEKNTLGEITTDINDVNPLTEKGKSDAVKAAKDLVKEGIDMIITSPFQRARETAKIVQKELGLSENDVIIDKRIQEVQFGSEWEGKLWKDFHATYTLEEQFALDLEGGENRADLKKRAGEFLYDIEKTHQGKNILIISHGGVISALKAAAQGATVEQSIAITQAEKAGERGTGTYMSLDFVPLPHNENYELDPHRPFIDEVVLEKDGKEYHRVKEVIDVWFDSGAMPFAQDHYLGDERLEERDGELKTQNSKLKTTLQYPADFISEAIDQTRGWFYTLHAIGNLLGKGKAYKNVICLGHILDAEGQKMSKSKGNTVNPWDMIEKYGIDTIRYWMYSVNQPGDSKNFDEKTVVETQRKVFGMLDNVVKFYELYASADQPSTFNIPIQNSTNILDQWILAKLNELIETCTKYLDEYKLMEPTREIREFIAELSQWYIRRSRDRFKTPSPQSFSAEATKDSSPQAGEQESGGAEGYSDRDFALATTQHVLLELAKLLAPFAPFFAEDIYGRVGGKLESVHLESWPEDGTQDAGIRNQVIGNMEYARSFISIALMQRAEHKIKVRQPLQSLTIKHSFEKLPEGWGQAYEDIIKDEVNVKEVTFGDETKLDTEITPELQLEGDARELIRQIQEMRKKAGLNPEDRISLAVQTDEAGEALIQKFMTDLQSTAGVTEVAFENNDGEELSVNDNVFIISFK